MSYLSCSHMLDCHELCTNLELKDTICFSITNTPFSLLMWVRICIWLYLLIYLVLVHDIHVV